MENRTENLKIVNWKDLLQRGFDKGLIEKIMPLCLRDLNTFLYTLQMAVDQSSVDEVKRSAHAIKGTAANMGAEQLSTAALELELIAEKQNLTDAPACLEKIQKAFDRLRHLVSQPDWIEPFISISTPGSPATVNS